MTEAGIENFVATMTKEETVDAITTETHLEPGDWCAPWDSSACAERAVDLGQCSVCVVGAILWRAGLGWWETRRIAYCLIRRTVEPFDSYKEFLACIRTNPLEALSRAYEQACRGFDYLGKPAVIEDSRLVALEVVREHFPEVLRLRWSATGDIIFNVRYELEGAS